MACRSTIVVVGSDAFSNVDFSSVINDLSSNHEIIYLPDMNACLTRATNTVKNTQKNKDSYDSEWYIFSKFESATHLNLLLNERPNAHIMGYPAFVEVKRYGQVWTKPRPVFNFFMLGTVVCITGFTDKQFVNRLATLINWMGGSVRRSYESDATTHLVAYRCCGEKVRDASLASNKIPIVKCSWVEGAWSLSKNSLSFSAIEPSFLSLHRAKVFQETCIAFMGFSENSSELAKMQKLVVDHDGLVVVDDNLMDERLTHVVVSDYCHQQNTVLEVRYEGTLDANGSDDLSVYEVSISNNEDILDCHLYAAHSKPSALKKLESLSIDDSIAPTENSSNARLSYSVLENLNAKFGPYRVPVLRTDWFWISLQLNYLCPFDAHHYDFSQHSLITNRYSSGCPSSTKMSHGGGSFAKSKKTRALLCRNSFSETDLSRGRFCIRPKLTMDQDKVDAASFDDSSKQSNSIVEQTFCAADDDSRDQLEGTRDCRSNQGDSRRSPSLGCQSDLQDNTPIVAMSNHVTALSFDDDPSAMRSSVSKFSPNNRSIPLIDSIPFGDDSLANKVIPLSTPTSGKRKSSTRLSLFHSTARKSRTPVSDFKLNSCGSISAIDYSLGGDSSNLHTTPLRVILEKRQHRIFEFFLTEHNYLNILNYLYRDAYVQILDESQAGGQILPRTDADYMFGKLGPICELHERLHPKLTDLEKNWSLTDSCLSDALQMSLLDEMDKAYGNYMQFYSPSHLQQLSEEYPRFLAFMRQLEKRKESGRQSLTALLVRPVQRLPSIALLMEGIAKFTPSTHPDYKLVKDFAQGINDLLTRINDRLRKNEERLSLLSLYHEISGAPPEMLSSSRSLVTKLNVFELVSNSSGNMCEPVTLFLLTDSLEVARPRKRHTGEPVAHAIRAALAAVQGNGSDSLADGGHDSLGNGSHWDGESLGKPITRKGSGASISSIINFSALKNGKQICRYKHLHLLKLNEIKRVVNFDTASADRAAFGLVVRSSSDLEDRVYAYCLAASFAASAAIVSGRCPEPVEYAMASTDSDCHVTRLQACVGEAKRVFLHRLCQLICQVSCLVQNPDDLLIDVEPEELLGFDLEQVFNANAMALSSKRLTRQLTRNISVKTPRRAVNSSKRAFGLNFTSITTPMGANHSHRAASCTNNTPIAPNTAATAAAAACSNSNEAQTTDICPHPSPRRSMLGSLLGSSCTSLTNFLTTTMRSTNLPQLTASPACNGIGRVLQPPNRLAMTPKPVRRLLPTLVGSKHSSFDDLELNKENHRHIGDDELVEEEDDDMVVHTESDAFFYGKSANSMISLSSWGSNSTLDTALHRLDLIAHRKHANGLYNSKCMATNSAIWETASHLGISTNSTNPDGYSKQRQRHSTLRSPSSSSHFELDSGRSKAKHKKPKKTKLRAVSQLFQRSSLLVKSRESRKLDSDHAEMGMCNRPVSEHANSSRRDSLLRGLFFRQH